MRLPRGGGGGARCGKFFGGDRGVEGAHVGQFKAAALRHCLDRYHLVELDAAAARLIARRAGGDARSHNVVRARAVGGGTRYAAVFPALPAGDYVIWQDDAAAAGTVTIRGGQVASFRLAP